MAKEMLINASEGEECRIAVVEDGKLEELYMERTSSTSHVGNIYKGKVTNVEPSIQAAFIDFGLGRNGFLHISDLMPQYFGRKHEDVTEAVGRKIARKDRPPIQRCLKRGDDIIVQIIKEGIGTKGPTLSTYVSIPGRILVMMPGMSKFGISRKIEDEDERRRLRGILDGLKCPDDVGFIVRTAGVSKSKAEISRDLQYLTRLWKNINDKLKVPAPVQLYTEGDLVTRTVRDVFSTDIDRIVVDNKDMAKKVKEFFKIAMPRTKNRVELHEEQVPLFHKYKIEHEIEQIYSRHVPLPSGGSLVIDSTEAIVAIDVNSGKFRDHSDAETTAFRTDLEAADEIPRQLKLRDLGGVIICDFIDLRFERHRRELEKKLHDNLKRDRAKTKVLRMSQFGIIEMTRQRMRPSLKKSIYCDCPHCKGSGLIKTNESMALDMMRRLMTATTNDKVVRVELAVHPEVAFYLLNKKRQQISELESDGDRKVLIRHDGSLALDEFRLTLYDAREGLVFLSELGVLPPQRGHGGRGGDRNQRRDQRGGRHQQQQRRREEPMDEDRFDLEDDAAPPRMLPPREADKEEAHAADEAAEQIEDAEDVSQVVDVEDGAEPMGDAPRGFDDRRDDRRRGRRDDRRDGGRPDRRPQQQQQHRQHQQRDIQPRANQPRPARPPIGESPAQDQPEREPQHDSHDNRQQGHRDDGEGGGPRRRRRRRRGGRGRGGGQGQQHGPPNQNGSGPRQPDEDAQPAFPPDEAEDAPLAVYDDPESDIPGPGNEKDAPPPELRRDDDDKKRRRRRGGRRHRERRERATTRGPQNNRGPKFEGLPVVDGEEIIPPRPPTASRPAGAPAPRPALPPKIEVVKTGSVDKHLADDVPVDYEQTPRRPRSYRDLDELPDFDE